VRPGAPAGVHEPLGTDGEDLDLVVWLLPDGGGFERQRVGAQRVEPEPDRPRRADGQAHVVRVLPLQVSERADRRSIYLDDALDPLGCQAGRLAVALPLRPLPATLQKLVGPHRGLARLLDQKKLLLKPDAAVH
jgi:hypothetical protein